MVANYAGRHFGFSMSIFNIGGTLAFGLGPLFIAYIRRPLGAGGFALDGDFRDWP